ncbi:hypothetical protein Tco_0810445 [Tanacetum coccineum]
MGKQPSSTSGAKLYSVTPLPKSKVIPKVGESKALINPFKASRVDNFVPNKHVKASIRTKPITVSQPHVITKEDVNSNKNGFSPNNVEITTSTRRPQPRNNPKNDKVLSRSKSSCLSNNLEKIEENHRSLQSSSYLDHTSSACNNIKLAIQNEKSKVNCATCKQCLITANHDECVLQYVNGMKSRKKNQITNVSKSANQKKHKAKLKKSKKLGSKKRLASPRPKIPRTCLSFLTVALLVHDESRFKTSCSIQSLIHDESSNYQSLPQISDEQALPHKNILWYTVNSKKQKMFREIDSKLSDLRSLGKTQDRLGGIKKIKDKDFRISVVQDKSRQNHDISILFKVYQVKDPDPRSQACK